jgi:prepilin-type N-terminal cleavage/methylation domain-containing protein
MIYNRPHKSSKPSLRGFTLIELLVAVLIIGILAAIALPQYQFAVKKSRAMEILSIIRTIAQAEEIYYLTNGRYTANKDELDVDFKDSKYYDILLEKQGTIFDIKVMLKGKGNKSSHVFRYFGQKSSGGDDTYRVYDTYTGHFLCIIPQDDNSDEKLCIALGGKDKQIYPAANTYAYFFN